jgi:hypothetical protein
MAVLRIEVVGFDNDALASAPMPEALRIIREALDKIERRESDDPNAFHYNLWDINGNLAGSIEYNPRAEKGDHEDVD